MSNTYHPGQVEWEVINLNGLDLRPFVHNIKIYENIFQQCMFVEMAVLDSVNIIGKLDIDGTNVVKMKIRSPFFESDADAIDKTFGVVSISDRVVRDDRQQLYVMHLLSLEGVRDASTRFSKTFKGSTDGLLAQIYNDNIKIDKPLRVLGAPHKTNKFAFTSTNWTGMQCMEFLSKHAEPKDYDGKLVIPNSLFFETRTEFIAGSITEIIQEQKSAKVLYDEYNYLPTGDVKFLGEKDERISRGGYSYSSPFFSQKYCTVSKADMPSYFNEIIDQVSGYYGSTTVGIDLIKKLHYNMVFDYMDALPSKQYRNKINKSFDDFIHLADEKPSSDSPIFSPQALTNMKIGTSNLYSDTDFGYTIQHFEKVTMRNTAAAELHRLSMKIQVPGKTDVSVGKLIRFNYPSVGEKNSGASPSELFDSRISGIWAITGIVHNMTHLDHTMTLEITRDAHGED